MVMRTSGVKIVRAMQTLARALAMVRATVRSYSRLMPPLSVSVGYGSYPRPPTLVK